MLWPTAMVSLRDAGIQLIVGTVAASNFPASFLAAES